MQKSIIKSSNLCRLFRVCAVVREGEDGTVQSGKVKWNNCDSNEEIHEEIYAENYDLYKDILKIINR